MRLGLWVTLLCSITMEAEDLHIRAQVVAVVDGELSPRLKTQISHDLEAIDGVLVVEKEPDYLIGAIGRTSGNTIAIALEASENLGGYVGQALVLASAPELSAEQRVNLSIMIGSLSTVPQLDVEVGAMNELPALTLRLIKQLDATLFAREREYPRGGLSNCRNESKECLAVFENFLMRIGAKRVVSPPDPRRQNR